MPDALHFTGDPDADALIAGDPLALLIGFALDQQVPVPMAFAGPKKLRDRFGGLDAAAIAALPPDELEAAFREKPAVHRFPGAMAKRVQELCAHVAEEYGDDAARLWTEAADGDDLTPPHRSAARLRRDEGEGARSVLRSGSGSRRRSPRPGPPDARRRRLRGGARRVPGGEARPQGGGPRRQAANVAG